MLSVHHVPTNSIQDSRYHDRGGSYARRLYADGRAGQQIRLVSADVLLRLFVVGQDFSSVPVQEIACRSAFGVRQDLVGLGRSLSGGTYWIFRSRYPRCSSPDHSC